MMKVLFHVYSSYTIVVTFLFLETGGGSIRQRQENNCGQGWAKANKSSKFNILKPKIGYVGHSSEKPVK
jgi:hypothetical protein